MKKSILAVAIPALMAANSAFAFELLSTDTATVDFYGELRANIYDLDDENNTQLDAYADSIGVKLSVNVAPGLDAIGLLEFGTSPDESTQLNHKKAYAGFASDTLGTVTFGKQNLPFDALGNAALGYDFDENAEFGSTEHDSSVDYEYLSDMLWVNAAYGFPEGEQDDPEVSQLAVGVTFAGLTLNAGYSDEGNDLDNWIVEALYGIGDVVLAGQYAEQKLNDLDGNAYALAAAYNYGMGYLFAGYERKDDKDISAIDADYAYAGADYRFNEYARVFAEYGFEDPQGGDSQNKFNLGMRLYW